MASKTLAAGGGRSVLGSCRAKILLVDQDRGDLTYYELILQQAGCHVRACGSYDKAFSALTSERFDMVVVHQGGPNFEGKIIVQRAIQIDRYLPVLVLTRFLDTTSYLEAMQLGAVDYLEEPVKVSDLIQVLKTHLWSARSELRGEVR